MNLSIISLKKLNELDIIEELNLKLLVVTVHDNRGYPMIHKLVRYHLNPEDVKPVLYLIYIYDPDSSLSKYRVVVRFMPVPIDGMECSFFIDSSQDEVLIHGGDPVTYSHMLLDLLNKTLYQYSDF